MEVPGLQHSEAAACHSWALHGVVSVAGIAVAVITAVTV